MTKKNQSNKTSDNSNIQIFCYKAMPVRTLEIDGETWFVAKDVCDILELSNPTMAIESLDDDERSKYYLGRQGEANIINEAGLYRLTFNSRKPEAKAFTRWVTHDVLPSIRKTGSYSVHAAENKTGKKSHMSFAAFNSIDKLIEKAFKCKDDNDFTKLLALDKAFKDKHGYSALNSAGIFIDTECEGKNYHIYNLHHIDWTPHYKLRLDPSIALQKPYSEDYFLKENECFDD